MFVRIRGPNPPSGTLDQRTSLPLPRRVTPELGSVRAGKQVQARLTLGLTSTNAASFQFIGHLGGFSRAFVDAASVQDVVYNPVGAHCQAHNVEFGLADTPHSTGSILCSTRPRTEIYNRSISTKDPTRDRTRFAFGFELMVWRRERKPWMAP